jgi:signal peptidase II
MNGEARARLRFGLSIAVVVLILDQLTKWFFFDWLTGASFLAVDNGHLPRVPGIVVTEFFNLVTVWNYGVSFGIFNRGSDSSAWLLVALALAITGFLGFWLARAENRRVALGLGLVIGGAIGNIVDRGRVGAVFDFLDFHVAGWHWPAFNLADSAITIGVGLLLIDALFAPKPSGK